MVGCMQIKTPAQLEAAFSFFATTGSENFKLEEFEQACGVGKTMLPDLIGKRVISVSYNLAFSGHKSLT